MSSSETSFLLTSPKTVESIVLDKSRLHRNGGNFNVLQHLLLPKNVFVSQLRHKKAAALIKSWFLTFRRLKATLGSTQASRTCSIQPTKTNHHVAFFIIFHCIQHPCSIQPSKKIASINHTYSTSNGHRKASIVPRNMAQNVANRQRTNWKLLLYQFSSEIIPYGGIMPRKTPQYCRV